MPRNSYQKVSPKDKARLREMHQSGGNFVTLAKLLKINRSTAYSIVLRDDDTQPHGGKRYQKFDQEMLDFIIDCLEMNPLLTLGQLNRKLRDAYPEKPEVSDRTLSSKIEGLAYTLKLSRDSPADRNSLDTKVGRREYAEWCLSPQIVNAMKIYIDEFGCNIHCKRSFGRSKKGQRAYRQVATQPGRNITVCAAITSQHGIVHFEIYMGGMKKPLFREFLQAVSANIIAEHGVDQQAYLIFDNAPAHRNIEEEALGGTLPIKRLPKYSPFLNPIENAFSCWKSELKKNLAENMSIFLNPDNHGRDGMSLRDFRFLMMKREIEASSRIITSVKCQEWANHSMSYVPRCLREEDIS